MKLLLKSIIIASAIVASSTAAFASGPCDNTPLNLRNDTGHILEVKRAAGYSSTVSGPTEGKTIQPGETITWVVTPNSNFFNYGGLYLLLLDKSNQAVHEFVYSMEADWLFSPKHCGINSVLSQNTDSVTARNEHTASMQVDLIAK